MELTISNARAILNMPLTHSAVGICTPFCPGQKRPVLSLVFLCPSKIINKGLFPVKSFMVGCFRQLSSWSFLDDSANLKQLASNDFALKRGGLKSNPGETAMRNHTQKPTNSVSLKSIYSLLDSDNNLITSSFTFEQAKALSGHIQYSIIKFQAMVVDKYINTSKPKKRQGNPLLIAKKLDVMSRFYENIGAKHFDKRQQNKVLTDLCTAEIALSELIQFDTDELILLGKQGSALAVEINSAKKRLFETKHRFIKIVGEMSGGAV